MEDKWKGVWELDRFKQAYELLRQWKGDSYVHGIGVLDRIGSLAAAYGKRTLVVCNPAHLKPVLDRVVRSLEQAGVQLAGSIIVPAARPNSPREDVYRIGTYILHHDPDSIVVIGGGSAIDAVKAANALSSLGSRVSGEIDTFLGTNLVTEALTRIGSSLKPLIAVQTCASSASHLTKYANVTDPMVGQKKLFVDTALVPVVSLFDYETTVSLPIPITIDGAFDGIAHTFEVFCMAKETDYEKIRTLAECAISLVVEHTKALIEDPTNLRAREAIGLATDLGGYAIMLGGTSGAHLTSFSLVDILNHGTACGLLNPYYAVLYCRAIQKQLKVIGTIFASHGYGPSIETLSGHELAIAVAKSMMAFGKSINAPTTLNEVPGFSQAHVQRALNAAKDPQLDMKLKNMPVSMTRDDVDTYMEPLLRAAASGDLSLIKEL